MSLATLSPAAAGCLAELKRGLADIPYCEPGTHGVADPKAVPDGLNPSPLR